MKCFVLSLMLWTVNAAHAQSAPDCSDIRDAKERLACFDKQFPAEQAIESTPIEPKVAAPATPEPVNPPVADSSPQASSAPQVVEADRDDDSFGRRLGGFFSKPTAVSVQSRVKTVRVRDKQKMVFLLENDQIWIQSTPRNLPISVGDIVTIKNTRFGGYMMATENGTSTRVNRIQ